MTSEEHDLLNTYAKLNKTDKEILRDFADFLLKRESEHPIMVKRMVIH